MHFSTIPIFTYINNNFLPKDFKATYLIVAAFMAFNFLISAITHSVIEVGSTEYGSKLARKLARGRLTNDPKSEEERLAAAE
jgi:hypothetical protein